MEYAKLKTGFEIPVIGFGTWRLKGDECISVVSKALKLGYTHIDTAEKYENEKEIGKVIKNHDRSKLFITSKVFYDDLKHDDVIESCNQTLKDLGTDYLDLYLMHWPNKSIPMKETLIALAELVKQGKVRSVGVSNFTIAHLKEAIEINKIPICINQVEYHPYLNQQELLDFCKENGIFITAYCPNAQGTAKDDPVLKKIGEKHSKTASQVSQKWLLQKGMIIIPKSRSEEHMKENLDMFSWELLNEDMKEIDGLHKNMRLCNYDINEFDREI